MARYREKDEIDLLSPGPMNMKTSKSGRKQPQSVEKYWRRMLAPDSELELFGQINKILGPVEMRKNGKLWRKRIAQGPDERLALRRTIEDYDLPSWLSYEYQRNLIRLLNRQKRLLSRRHTPTQWVT